MQALHKSYVLESSGSSGSAGCSLPDGRELFLFTASSDPALATAAGAKVHATLARTLHMMVGVGRDAWVDNVSRKVSHHSGWLSLMDTYKMLRPAPVKRAALTLGQMGKQYEVIPFDVNVHGPLFAAAHVAQQHLNTIKPPCTIANWASATGGDLKKELESRGHHLPRAKTDGYTLRWTMRAHLVTEMRVAGITSLSNSGRITPRSFAELFPDQNGWICAWGEHHSDIKSLFHELSYTGPPELFSMYACLFGDESVMHTPVETLAQNENRLRVMREAYMASYGLAPHPAVLLRELADHSFHLAGSSGSSRSAAAARVRPLARPRASAKRASLLARPAAKRLKA